MTIELLSIPGVRRPVAVGLTWVLEPKRPTAAVRREVARRGGPWGVVRRAATGTYQIGHAHLRSSTKVRGVRALASLVADHQPSPWLGLYRVDADRSWLIAVTHDGEIIPDGDRLGPHGDMARQRDALRDQQSWREEEGDIADLATTIALAKSQPGLRDITQRVSPVVAAGAIGVTAIVILAAGGVYWQWQKDAAEQAERDQRLADVHRAQQAREAAEAAVPPWTRQPLPSAVVAACALAWQRQLPAKSGWLLTRWTCTPGASSVSLSSEWARMGGVAADAPGRLTGADQASESWLSQAALPAAATPALPIEPAQRAIWTFGQTYPVQLVLENVMAATRPTSSDEKAPPPPPWQIQQAHFTMVPPPWVGLSAALDDVPGLRVSVISYSGLSSGWSVDATLYAWRAPSALLRTRAAIQELGRPS